MQATFYSRTVRAIAILLGAAGISVVAIAPLLAQTQPAPAPTAPGADTPGTAEPDTAEPGVTPPTAPNPNATPPATPPAAQPAPTPDDAAPPTSSNASLTELLQQVSTQQNPSGNSFNTLAQAVAAADVAPLLQDTGPVTIFAPTDSAFAELPDGALELLLRPENRNLLRQVLAYHVVPGEVTSSQLQTGGVDTLNGGIAVRVTPERIVVNDGSVIRADIQASNGVVHAVNRVLLPPQIRQQLTAALNAQ